ncbi:MAG: hypothetical protein A3J83_05950 [Elusimicrobia bacterium RIFOXYA2_FULL_40_6]|nr:MAG: hypothetical protein A3J83_05950 [Elusimicrobia bacterium RIFOXYA2_FULL_40_6]
MFELLSIVSNWEENNKPIGTVISHYLELSNRAKMYLEENMANKICTNNLAKELHISPSRFAHIFKEINGCSATNYLTEMRLSQAKRILKASDKNISEIAYQVGFPDEHYFSRVFKKKEKCTPTQYRQKPIK